MLPSWSLGTWEDEGGEARGELMPLSSPEADGGGDVEEGCSLGTRCPSPGGARGGGEVLDLSWSSPAGGDTGGLLTPHPLGDWRGGSGFNADVWLLPCPLLLAALAFALDSNSASILRLSSSSEALCQTRETQTETETETDRQRQIDIREKTKDTKEVGGHDVSHRCKEK
jgi:hypothetical protein